MLNREQILDAVLDSVAETLSVPLGELSEHTLIREDLEADSMDVVTLMILLDDKFDAEFKPEDIPDRAISIGWVVDYIIEKLPTAANEA